MKGMPVSYCFKSMARNPEAWYILLGLVLVHNHEANSI